MKSGARYIAITSGPIGKRKGGKTILVGIIFRESYIEGLLSSTIQIDGTDSTKQIIAMIKSSRFNDQVRIILLNGIALAGLNIVNPKALEKRLDVKIVLLNRRRQNAKELINALKEFSRVTKTGIEQKSVVVQEHSKVKIRKVGDFFIQSDLDEHYLKSFVDKGFGALRISHIVASGISSGESKGRL